ncbi:uncharacterized protein FA14DRAFT_181179 [Meira miltonrushii]|uniref:Secreted protein n=1 Tax=Meira miltonrushii TaxID=1280837 RepID=A0A316V4V9_9BASI|nr:uncharacterized protein FA14DRAFT_181179 [Meira miltonrushii]PWN32492.1 hypothetical protein FA14DRAFT_181179 [Meira miltonrushii]
MPSQILLFITILICCLTVTHSAPINGKRPPPLQASKGHPVPPKTIGDALKNREIHDGRKVGLYHEDSRVDLNTGKVTTTRRPMTHAEMEGHLSVPFHEAYLGSTYEPHPSNFKAKSSNNAGGDVEVRRFDPKKRKFTASAPLTKKETDNLHASLSSQVKAIKRQSKEKSQQ